MKFFPAITCLLGLGLCSLAAEEEQSPAKAFLGIHVKSVPEEVRAQTQLADGEGLLIDFLQANSPAIKAGFKVYDILINFEDQKLVSGEQLANLIKSSHCGRQVKLSVLRQGKSQEVVATLGEAPLNSTLNLESDASDDLNSLLSKNPEATKIFQEIIKRLGKHIPEPADKTLNNQTASQAKSMSMSDKEGSVEISAKEGRHHATVKDNTGTVLYQGDLNTPEDRQKLAPEIRARIEMLEQCANEAIGNP